jgi:formamidopyrimidine-DNA glycosylase
MEGNVPELPDLQVIAEFLQREVSGADIAAVDVLKPIVLRNLTGDDLAARLVGQRIESVSRRGKFLLFPLSSGDWLVINPMLAGRLRYHGSSDKVPGKPFIVLRLANGMSLRYSDSVTMGKVYLTPALDAVPGFAQLGPEPLDPHGRAVQLNAPTFAARLRRHPGEIKGILTNQTFVAGIGNAYADEILFCARVYPFRKRPSLDADEVRRIYECMHTVLEGAICILRERVGADIHEEIRDFLQVHGRGGQPCPRCGNPISEIRARQRLTNFCRTCQPGTLIKK